MRLSSIIIFIKSLCCPYLHRDGRKVHSGDHLGRHVVEEPLSVLPWRQARDRVAVPEVLHTVLELLLGSVVSQSVDNTDEVDLGFVTTEHASIDGLEESKVEPVLVENQEVAVVFVMDLVDFVLEIPP